MVQLDRATTWFEFAFLATVHGYGRVGLISTRQLRFVVLLFVNASADLLIEGEAAMVRIEYMCVRM